jgi:hypothetical protein
MRRELNPDFKRARPIQTAGRRFGHQAGVEELRTTEWWAATVERHKAHVAACKNLKCEDLIEPFFRFADEVMSTPEEFRHSLFDIDQRPPYVAFQRYPAYIEPTKEEQKLDFYGVGMGRKLR